MNAMHFALIRTLQAIGLPVSTFTGCRTKFNRTRLGLPKTHALDAASSGNGAAISRRRTRVDR